MIMSMILQTAEYVNGTVGNTKRKSRILNRRLKESYSGFSASKVIGIPLNGREKRAGNLLIYFLTNSETYSL